MMRAEITLCPTCQHAAGGHNPDCSRARPAQGFAANSEARKRIRDAAFAPVAVRGEAVDAAVDDLLAADPAPAQPDAALSDQMATMLCYEKHGGIKGNPADAVGGCTNCTSRVERVWLPLLAARAAQPVPAPEVLDADALAAAIRRVEDSRQTHVEWRDYWREYEGHTCTEAPCPWEWVKEQQEAIAGDLARQERLVAEYDTVLGVLRSLVPAPEVSRGAAESWPYGDVSAAVFVAAASWPWERQENRDEWAPKMLTDAALADREIARARRNLDAAAQHVRDALPAEGEHR